MGTTAVTNHGGGRESVKRGLSLLAGRGPGSGTTLLIYHRISGDTKDERDLALSRFRDQLDVLSEAAVVSLDEALERLRAGDDAPTVVLTFDDGFADVYTGAFPLLAERRLPFTIYLASAYVGGQMHWDGSTATAPGPALTWSQLSELVASGLCTVGNHTHSHARPELLTTREVDRCTEEIQHHLGVTPRHFAYPWGVRVRGFEPELRARFQSAATGLLGRNHPSDDPIRLKRVPVRRTDPPAFFAAKLTGRLGPERTYAAMVGMAKRLGARG